MESKNASPHHQPTSQTPIPNARNWKPWQKFIAVLFVAAFAFLCTFASSIIAPGREKIQGDLHLSRTVSVLAFSLFNLGLALGPIIGSPASETFGRRAVYLVCMPLLLVFVLACGFSQSLASLLVCRFIGGLFGGPGLTIASATISDLFEPSERGLSLFCYYSMPWLGSVLGPLVGYLVVAHKGWEWTQWVYLFIALPIVLPGLLFLREICLYAGFNFGLIYAFILVMPDIFAETYGFTLTQQGLSFLGLIVGCIIGPIGLIIDDQIVRSRRQSKQQHKSDTEHQPEPPTTKKPPPESRLHGAMLGGLLLPTGLFWFALLTPIRKTPYLIKLALWISAI